MEGTVVDLMALPYQFREEKLENSNSPVQYPVKTYEVTQH
jgi:hypothetical protein